MNGGSLIGGTITVCAVALTSGGLTADAPRQARSSRYALVSTPRRLWTATGDVTYSSISSDGRFVAFVQNQGNQPFLVLHDTVNGFDVRLTDASSTGSPGRAIFSPNAKRVAFNWTNAGLDEIRVVDLNGPAPSAPQVIVRRHEETPSLWPGDWSPDGKSIAAIALNRDRTGQIALISVDDGSIHPLKSVGFARLWSFASSHVFFSPDGRYVAYGRLDLTNWTNHAWLLATDGSRETAAVLHPGDDKPAGWTPDGSKLLFLRNRNRSLGLWAQSIQNGRPTGNAQLIVPDFSPNRVYSYLGLSRDGDVYFSSAARETRIAVAALNSSSGKISTKTEVLEGIQHDWSRDGRSLAFKDAKGPSDPSAHTLTIQSFGSGPNRVLRPRLMTWNWPRWSPDGRTFLAQGTDDQGRQGIYRIDATTADLQSIALANPGEGLGFPQWFPDAQRIVFTRKSFSGERPTAIVERSLASGQERVLVERAGVSDECVLSPDGRFVAYIVRDPVLKRATIELAATASGERRELVTLEAGGSLGDWMPDSTALVYSRPTSAAAASSGNSMMLQTWIVPIDGGQSRQIILTDRLAQLARISPDGKQIAFLIPNQSPEQVWVIENARRTAQR